jgi:superfamily II DNA/RNA helicase
MEGVFKKKDKEELKAMVKCRSLRVLVGTDSASEGLNLQALGSLINIDLPWNPTKLEQRKGRIQRIGQVYDIVYIYNMRYKDSVEDRVHSLLSTRLKNI